MHWFSKTINISLVLKVRQAGSESGAAGPAGIELRWTPLQSLSVDRGRAGAILIDMDDDGDDDETDDDDNDDDDEDDDADDDDDDH